MYVVCNYCDAEFQVEAGTAPVFCPECHRRVPRGTSDWRRVYYEEVHRPSSKSGSRGEKVDKTHSRQKQLKRKIAKANRKFRYRVDPWELGRK